MLHVEVGIRAAPPQLALLGGIFTPPDAVGHAVLPVERAREGHQLDVRPGVHVPAEPVEETEQPRVVLLLTRTAELQEIRAGVGYRPMRPVEPTSPPRGLAVFLTNSTARGGRADAPPPRHGPKPGGGGEGRTDVGLDGHRRLPLARVPTTPRRPVVQGVPWQHGLDRAHPGSEPTCRRRLCHRGRHRVWIGPHRRVSTLGCRVSRSCNPVGRPSQYSLLPDLGNRG